MTKKLTWLSFAAASGPLRQTPEPCGTEESRIQDLITRILERMSIESRGAYSRRGWAFEKGRVSREVEKVSQSFCANVGFLATKWRRLNTRNK